VGRLVGRWGGGGCCWARSYDHPLQEQGSLRPPRAASTHYKACIIVAGPQPDATAHLCRLILLLQPADGGSLQCSSGWGR